tara:strand:+ start:6809 stop:7033 length:225 start_codon:yes stop_codon:yes gene_type:complete
MKVGDAVWVSEKKDTVGVLLSQPRRTWMVGITVEVLVDGRVQRMLAKKVQVVKTDRALAEISKCTLADVSTQLD